MDIVLENYYQEAIKQYKSKSQIARVVTENWCIDNMYCPFCNSPEIKAYENNKKVFDFFCDNCGQQFQLKSKRNSIGSVIIDGEYNTMIRAISKNLTPNLFLMSYSKNYDQVCDFIIIPKYLIFPNNIIKRKPLSPKARRAGWVGCNIDISNICDEGKIKVIDNGNIMNAPEVRKKVQFSQYIFSNDFKTGSWINDVLIVISKMKKYFSLSDIYLYTEYFKVRHPENNNIEAKVRQQLQFLRDKGYLEFLGQGQYKRLR